MGEFYHIRHRGNNFAKMVQLFTAKDNHSEIRLFLNKKGGQMSELTEK